MTIQEQKLRTILEREETTQGLAVEADAPQTTFTYVPELHTQPVYSRVVRKPNLQTMSTELVDTRNITETTDSTEMRRYAVAPEPPVVPERRPEVTSHVVDDVFLRTITEKKTIEDIERHRRQVSQGWRHAAGRGARGPCLRGVWIHGLHRAASQVTSPQCDLSDILDRQKRQQIFKS